MILVIITVGLILAASTAAVIAYVRRVSIAWEPLELQHGGQWFQAGTRTLTSARVSEALAMAAELLRTHTKWRYSFSSLTPVKIYVMPTDNWVDSSGQQVAGQLVPRFGEQVMVVGPSLSALCHELAHQLQAEIDLLDPSSKASVEHANWDQLGITAACNEFVAWVKRP